MALCRQFDTDVVTRDKILSVFDDQDGIEVNDFLLDAFSALGTLHPLRKDIRMGKMYTLSELVSKFVFSQNELAALAHQTIWLGKDAIVCIESLPHLHSIPTESLVKILKRGESINDRKLRKMVCSLTDRHISEWVQSRICRWNTANVLFELMVYGCDNEEYIEMLQTGLPRVFCLELFAKCIDSPVPPIAQEMFVSQRRWGRKNFILNYLEKTYDNRNKKD